jgi:hypothetical protein
MRVRRFVAAAMGRIDTVLRWPSANVDMRSRRTRPAPTVLEPDTLACPQPHSAQRLLADCR